MASNNFWSNLVTTLTSLPTNTTASVSAAINSVIGNHFTALTTMVQNLSALGPGADATQLALMLNSLTTAASQITGTPQSEFTFITILRGLIGKTDAPSIVMWGQVCGQMITLLNNSSSSILSSL